MRTILRDPNLNRKRSDTLKGRTFPHMTELGIRLNNYLSIHPELRHHTPDSEALRKQKSDKIKKMYKDGTWIPNTKPANDKIRQNWLNKEYKERRLRELLSSLYPKPNNQERILSNILNETLPGTFQYTGDGKTVINRMVPDFTNIDGKKQVIELFGDYWHSQKITKNQSENRTELGRIKAYNLVGYNCLIIWESELQDREKVAIKIKEFSNAHSSH